MKCPALFCVIQRLSVLGRIRQQITLKTPKFIKIIIKSSYTLYDRLCKMRPPFDVPNKQHQQCARVLLFLISR